MKLRLCSEDLTAGVRNAASDIGRFLPAAAAVLASPKSLSIQSIREGSALFDPDDLHSSGRTLPVHHPASVEETRRRPVRVARRTMTCRPTPTAGTGKGGGPSHRPDRQYHAFAVHARAATAPQKNTGAAGHAREKISSLA